MILDRKLDKRNFRKKILSMNVIVELDEVPLTYLPSNAILIRAKAAGDLASG